ncbi:MAG: hypothetical protein BWX92_02937 [Deltaproteobacteria bacterium ADurb.Bin135]|nr:MAG: hypothetical protein BWX92_02937 [Deltaproteobacteria bacterium ADurb.Bin135]
MFFKLIMQAVVVILLLTMTLFHLTHSAWYPQEDNTPSPQEQTRDLLKVVPVYDLILQEATLDIITQAKFDEQGNPLLYFASAGTFGQTQSKLVLFRGCVQIRYGVDMTDTRLEVTSDGNGSILVKLPEPRIIGNPIILTEPPCQSRILDVQGEGWWAGRIARAEVTNQIGHAYVTNAPKICAGLGLEQKTKERAEQVLRAFLKPLLQDKQLVIQWAGKEGKTTEQQEGETNHADNKTDNWDIVDCIAGGVDDYGIYLGESILGSYTLGEQNYGEHYRLAGDVDSGFPREQIRPIQDGGI